MSVRSEEKQKLDSFGCRGNTIKVASGHYVDIGNPDPESIDLYSIAAALSRICRFGGHCPNFYSVAEHSVNAFMLATRDGVDREVRKAILFHDAAEAYIGDMVKPLKLLLPEFKEIEQRFEQRFEAAIAVRFGLPTDCDEIIKRYDRQMLKAEKLALWPDDSFEWSGFGEVPTRDIEIACLPPNMASQLFFFSARMLGVE